MTYPPPTPHDTDQPPTPTPPPAPAPAPVPVLVPVGMWWCGSQNHLAGGDVVDSVYAATHEGLQVLQSWLARDRADTLVVLTHGAVGVGGEDVTDLAAAAVWGLVRSAQTEHPGQVVLIDTDTHHTDVDAGRAGRG